MATYMDIQQYVRKIYGFQPKPCWPAHVKELCGIPVKVSPRRISPSKRQVPCPPEKAKYIKEAFHHFNMV